MASSSSSDGREEERRAMEREEVAELEEAATQARNGQKDENQLTQLIQKNVRNFQDHANNRSRQAHGIHMSPFFGATSCTPLENSVKWMAGCRPASYVRFLYALSGIDIQSHMTQFLRGEKVGDLGELTSNQINMIDSLQANTIKEEKKLCSKLASLQEDIVDQPIASKIKNEVGECGNVDEALNEHGQRMTRVMEEADELRMNTLKEIVLNILKPLQAVEYLAAAKRLKLCFKIWAKDRD